MEKRKWHDMELKYSWRWQWRHMGYKLDSRCCYILIKCLQERNRYAYFRKTTCQTTFSWQSEIKSSQWPSLSHTKGLQVVTMLSTPVRLKGGIDSSRGGMGHWHPWAIFLAESRPQQANTTGKQWPAIKRKLSPSQSKNGGYWAFPIQSPRLHFWVTVGEKLRCSGQSNGVTLQPFNITNCVRKVWACLLTIWRKPNVSGRQTAVVDLNCCLHCRICASCVKWV